MNNVINLSGALEELMEENEKIIGSGFGDKNGLTIFRKGDITQDDIADGVSRCVEKALAEGRYSEESYFEHKETGESPATEFITVSGYKQKNLQLIATSVVKELYLVQIVQS
ncbi:Oidioi.mRNA.OKI2018_I69.chr2.g6636.t1.cds [Oikopleura dioica]|uniref:Oidioi.mRNA.OKI2018_I69.chr2.g6636.t1.cds n=1 Tax=Oikopleura dioica TaxID=34765 RepID=A0ABN7T8F4_OIKDI|nr:Oidioi.mRNA.OKI2018_I69.chr2.g6636.t1.cds [Oikopleura dioica]